MLAVAVTMYNDSDSDFDFALTQNKFRESPSSGEYNTDNAISDLLGEPMPTFEKLVYQPVVSDVSDNELLAASFALEDKANVKLDRFESPKRDDEMAGMSTRR